MFGDIHKKKAKLILELETLTGVKDDEVIKINSSLLLAILKIIAGVSLMFWIYSFSETLAKFIKDMYVFFHISMIFNLKPIDDTLFLQMSRLIIISSFAFHFIRFFLIQLESFFSKILIGKHTGEVVIIAGNLFHNHIISISGKGIYAVSSYFPLNLFTIGNIQIDIGENRIIFKDILFVKKVHRELLVAEKIRSEKSIETI